MFEIVILNPGQLFCNEAPQSNLSLQSLVYQLFTAFNLHTAVNNPLGCPSSHFCSVLKEMYLIQHLTTLENSIKSSQLLNVMLSICTANITSAVS
jgi:hypothetical protein